MRSARQLATLRFAYAVGAVLIPGATAAAAWATLGRDSPATTAVVAGATVLGAVGFFWSLFLWRPRCPACRVGRARFVKRESAERLRCDSCPYDEPTGWTFE